MRWEPGFICSGNEFESFWSDLKTESTASRKGLFIAGRGFDPRTTEGPSVIARVGFPIEKFWAIRLTDPLEVPDRPRNPAAAENESQMRDLFPDAKFEICEIAMRNDEGRLVGSAEIRRKFADPRRFSDYTDIIVDITAMPTSVSFPLLGTLISLADEIVAKNIPPFNLHCIVCENAELDEMISQEGGDFSDYIDPFRGKSGLAAQPDPITIWAPVLGERQFAPLQKIHEMLSPAEVKPFLPSPSLDPRRADQLVAEYHTLLFDTFEVGPRGFIYADERDPFDIYRQISELAVEYARALSPLGTTNTVVSAHSSKLLSLGVLLAAFENDLAIAHVEPTGYDLDPAAMDVGTNELFEIWLTGAAYDAD